MESSHGERVAALLDGAEAEHRSLLARLPPEIGASLPVDAQGLTLAIDHLAAAAGLSASERRALVRPHAVNPAVLHARVFGAVPLARETVIGAFVEGARVRADALSALADRIGGEALGREVRELLVAHPPPLADAPGEPTAGGPRAADDRDPVASLRATYGAQERAAVMIAAALDVVPED